MVLIVCFFILLISLLVGAYCVGKGLDIKYKDDYLFTHHPSNTFGEPFDTDVPVAKDKINNEE